jgi:fructose 1,6-bisphosphatase
MAAYRTYLHNPTCCKSLIDHYTCCTGDDITILLIHNRGIGDKAVHKVAWYVFLTDGEVAKGQGQYGASQDLLRDTFSGDVRGMRPAVAEMEFEERPNESLLFFAIHEGRLTESMDALPNPSGIGYAVA